MLPERADVLISAPWTEGAFLWREILAVLNILNLTDKNFLERLKLLLCP
jgi:hypothetical protein